VCGANDGVGRGDGEPLGDGEGDGIWNCAT